MSPLPLSEIAVGALVLAVAVLVKRLIADVASEEAAFEAGDADPFTTEAED